MRARLLISIAVAAVVGLAGGASAATAPEKIDAIVAQMSLPAKVGQLYRR